MGIRVRHDPDPFIIGQAAALAGYGQFAQKQQDRFDDLNRQRQQAQQFLMQLADRERARQYDAWSQQAAMQQRIGMMQQGAMLDAAQQQAGIQGRAAAEREMFDYEFTAKQQQQIAQINNAKAALEQHKDLLSPEEYERTLANLDLKLSGIEPLPMPKPKQESIDFDAALEANRRWEPDPVTGEQLPWTIDPTGKLIPPDVVAHRKDFHGRQEAAEKAKIDAQQKQADAEMKAKIDADKADNDLIVDMFKAMTVEEPIMEGQGKNAVETGSRKKPPDPQEVANAVMRLQQARQLLKAQQQQQPVAQPAGQQAPPPAAPPVATAAPSPDDDPEALQRALQNLSAANQEATTRPPPLLTRPVADRPPQPPVQTAQTGTQLIGGIVPGSVPLPKTQNPADLVAGQWYIAYRPDGTDMSVRWNGTEFETIDEVH